MRDRLARAGLGRGGPTDLYHGVTDRITAALEAGTIAWPPRSCSRGASRRRPSCR